MIHSVWTSVFWPYFQFVVFVIALVWLARKPIHSFLESKRMEFRTKLSEAHEALVLAERKIKQYEAQLDSLTQQVQTIQDQYKQNTEIEQKRILDDANAMAEALINDAKRAAMELISKTQNELKQEMMTLVLKEFENKLSSERLAQLENNLRQEAIHSIPQALNTQSSHSSSV